MSAGRLLKQGPLADVLAEMGSHIRVSTATPADAGVVLSRLGLAVTDTGLTSVVAELNGIPPEQVNARLVEAGIPVREFSIERPALEDLFVHLTGEGFDVIG